MSDYVTLMGAEQVKSAGYAMRSAAEDMNRAASSMAQAVSEQRQIFDNFLLELKDILADHRQGMGVNL